MRIRLLLVILFCSLGLISCNGGHLSSSEQNSEASVVDPGPTELATVSPEDRQRAYRRASLIFLEKAPTQEELQAVATQAGYNLAIEGLVENTQFVNKIKSYHQNFFDLEGSMDGINYNEPANLAAYLFKENLDFREILKADYCIKDDLTKGPCSSFGGSEELAKENAAGVVTTQAFLKKWEGPFNFRRSSHMLQAFACHDYPDDSDSGLFPEEISEDVHTFACTDCNPKCYSCHRTMNARSSLFYKFDTTGAFNTDPSMAVAIKRDDGNVSTVSDLLKEGVKPRYRQQEVSSLKQYATELTRTPKFRKCLAKRLTLLSLGATTHEGNLPLLLEQVDSLLIRHQFQIKNFYKELLGSDEYVLQ